MNKMIKILPVIVIIFVTVSGRAMPPHPDLVDEWKNEGTLVTKMKTVQAVDGLKSVDVSKSASGFSGTIKIPVILVEYSDLNMDSASTATFYSELLNGTVAKPYSVKKYYSDMSNGNMVLQFEVFDVVTVAGTLSDYGAHSGSNTDVDPGQLVYDAVSAMVSANDALTDFRIFDNNGDGYIDCVVVIHAGAGEEYTGTDDQIWSHMWTLTDAGTGTVTADGVKFNVYTIQPEYLDAAGDSTIGVYCHEFGHVLGLPDLYDTSGETNGAGNWSVMANGSWCGPDGDFDGSRPSPLLAWERYRLGGSLWLRLDEMEPVFTIRHDGRGWNWYVYAVMLSIFIIIMFVLNAGYFRRIAVSAAAVVTVLVISCGTTSSTTEIDGVIDDIENSHKVYRIPLGNRQYLYLEGKTVSKSSEGWSSTGWYVPGTGVLVTHVHEGIISTYLNLNTVNYNSSRVHGVNIVEAKTSVEPGLLWTNTAYYGSADDLFCFENNDTLGVWTTPGTKYYTGTNVGSKSGDSGVTISSFSTKAAFPITFYVNID